MTPMERPYRPEDYPAAVAWSDEDGEFVATTPAFPFLSALAPTEAEALHELRAVLGDVLDDLAGRGERPPAPILLRGSPVVAAFSGQFRVRMPKELHAALARAAGVNGVSLNTYIVSRLAAATGS